MPLPTLDDVLEREARSCGRPIKLLGHHLVAGGLGLVVAYSTDTSFEDIQQTQYRAAIYNVDGGSTSTILSTESRRDP